ncbi:carbamoyltransferase [Hoyosella sp. YIM 151337]|uniref:carbamoyltransferase family protein n=1 Tax=Hoyosella sp. YIM 151337 TaxID=2992742 RepID=UPI002235E4AA|nr:carbamoyltransferase C-terminal domain-containing protein [Hoyosella sp. YIM 151337]MCW4355511.1 carbamoyltransferase [Hoyosella sp. YIM 151337]
MRVLGINAVFHDPSAALVVDGRIVAAAEEERFSRRKHGKRPVPFAAWELPEQAAAWCLQQAGLSITDIDAVAYSYDPARADDDGPATDPVWEHLRTHFAQRAPYFLRSVFPDFDVSAFQHVRHHVAHAASAGLAAPFGDCAVLVTDGRGESTSALAGEYRDGKLDVLSEVALPHSLGLFYEDATEHLGFTRSSDEYKVMALASYGSPRFAPELRLRVQYLADGTFQTEHVDFGHFLPRRARGDEFTAKHADFAASVQLVTEEVLLRMCKWLHHRTGARNLAMAGGVALNCVANTRVLDESPFDNIWVQPAAGDAGTALGAALAVAAEGGDAIEPMRTAALGRGFTDAEIEAVLQRAKIRYERPDDLAHAVAECLADNAIVGWFQGQAEFGPRALGQRSLLAHPGYSDNLERLNDVKGREQFRPIAPMVLADRASRIFSRGPLPSPYMLFVHDVDPDWRHRIPAVTHVDGTARIQTVSAAEHPVLARTLEQFEALTGLPTVVNTSFNTAGRPIVDSPRDALECFGASPIDVLAIGPFLVRRP